MARQTLLVLALALVAVACGQTADDPEIRPFEDVQDSEITVENDPDFPGRAIFRVTTTEPLICAIVWGETEEFGNQNNSLNMNGTGIVQHDVFLPGAEAGSTYFYRLQGSGADGTIYVSDTMTFTLSPRDDTSTAPDLGANLATGADVVDVSSEFSSGFAAANAVDGDLSTEWSSAGEGDEASITIDLGSAVDIGQVTFITRTMTDGSARTNTYTVSVDGGEPLGPFDAGSPADPNPVQVDATGRELRFDVENSTGGNTGAVEIGVFAP